MKRAIVLLAAIIGLCGLGIGCAAMTKESDEVKVKLTDCPKPVQDTVAREAQGGQVGEVEKELKDGKTVYEADATIGGKKYEIKVAEDGTLISKKLDEDEDEKDEK